MAPTSAKSVCVCLLGHCAPLREDLAFRVMLKRVGLGLVVLLVGCGGGSDQAVFGLDAGVQDAGIGAPEFRCDGDRLQMYNARSDAWITRQTCEPGLCSLEPGPRCLSSTVY